MFWLSIIIIAVLLVVCIGTSISSCRQADEEYLRQLLDTGEIMKFLEKEINSPERKAARERLVEVYITRESINHINHQVDSILARVKRIGEILSSS